MMNIDFGDKRVQAAAQDLHAALIEHQSVQVRQLGQGRAGEVRFGRLLNNERLRLDKLIEGACQGVGERCAARHVLLIQDTSEINFQSHAARVRGLGTVGNGVDAGMFVHPVLAVDAQDGACLGLAHLHLWQRTQGKAANYRALPIEAKETGRWIDAPCQARARLGQAERMTVVADREADIFELWARLPDARTDLLIRARHDRALHTPHAEGLFAWLSSQPVGASYALELPATAKRPAARTARMQLRFGSTAIARPRSCSDKRARASVQLWAIEVREEADSTPEQGQGQGQGQQQEPVHWRLLTTHAIAGAQDALQCVQWYCQRWHIEQTFRTLKRQGLDIESSQLEQASRLERLAVLALSAAVHTMQLTLARQGKSSRPATDCFAPGEHALLAQVGTSLQGKTNKQKNPHAPATLAWAAWIVARLGGWKGYASERAPGPITMLHGLQALANIRRGWELARGPG